LALDWGKQIACSVSLLVLAVGNAMQVHPDDVVQLLIWLFCTQMPAFSVLICSFL
jgi:hypothetical protein